MLRWRKLAHFSLGQRVLLPEAEEAEAEEAEAEEAEAEEAEEVFFFADRPGGGGQLPTGTQGGRPAQTKACASSSNETISILGNLAAPGGKRNVQHPSVGGGLASVAKCPTRAAPKRGARTEATRLQDLNHRGYPRPEMDLRGVVAVERQERTHALCTH